MNIHISKKLVSIIAGLGLIMLPPVFAHAECTQSDLAGTWYAYAATMLRCKVKVNSSGSIISSKSLCKFRDETGQYSASASGSMGISDNCLISGKITVCDAECANLKIEHGRLERDNNMFVLEVNAPAIDPATSISLVGVKKQVLQVIAYS